jgi:hypothetical protein
MDLTVLWYETIELPLNVVTILISLAAVVYWVKLFNHIKISGRQDEGWLWIFASVLMVLLLNVSTLLLVLTNGMIPFGAEKVVTVDVHTLDFITTVSRAIMAISMTVGAYMLYESVKAGGDVKFVFSPVQPQAEATSDSAPKYDIMPGISYLVKEGAPSGSMRDYYIHSDRRTITGVELFKDLVTHGTLGFCATRRYPPKIREDFGLLKTPMVWLTQEKGFADAVHPGDLPELSHMIKDFISKGGDTVVLMEGIEYLVLHNSFEDVLRLIQGLDDVVVQHKSRLIVSLDPSAVTDQQYHLIARELTEFTPH